MPRGRFLFVWVVGVLAPTLSTAGVLTVVNNGRPTATIVVRAAALEAPKPVLRRGKPLTPDQKVALAAADLQTYVEKMSGATLPIVSDTGAGSGAVILVGPSKRTEALGLSIPSGLTPERREEGFLIHARGDVLVLAGNDRGPYFGTHYAVAEWLGRRGVRWYMPTAFGEVVPRRRTITVENVEFRDHPDFVMRAWWSHLTPEMAVQEYLWKIRNKMQPDEREVIAMPGDSSIRRYLPDKAYLKTHPEYFAQRLDGSAQEHMPSLSHPTAARLVAEKIKAKLRARQKATGHVPHSLGFAPDDGLPMDYAKETMKVNLGLPGMLGREGVVSERSITEEWFRFVNRVAADVVAEYPNVILTTNGYANRDIPPEGVALHPNLGIMYAAIWADTLKPFDDPRSWHGAVQGATIRRWCALNKRVFLYNYNYNMLVTCLTPTPTTRKLRRNMPLLKKWGVFGFCDETRQAYMEHGITTRYLRARLEWDAESDVDATLGEFFRLWYGPAAAEGKGFWDALEERIQATPLLGHEDRILPYVYTADLLARLEGHVARAERLATDEPYATRVRVDRHILEHLKAYMAMHEAEFDGRFAEAARQADVMFGHREKLHAICPFFNMPESADPRKRYLSGAWYWNLTNRRAHYRKLDAMTNGKTGTLLVMAPRHALFRLDEADMGRFQRWHEPGWDRSAWRRIDTTTPFYLEGGLSDQGVPYVGAMWYVFDLDVPASAAGKPLRLYSPVVTTEAWAWVNGRYVGHRRYLEAYIRPAPLDLDVTDAIRPGARNVIGVRVSTGLGRTQAAEGFQGRLFLYTPIAEGASGRK